MQKPLKIAVTHMRHAMTGGVERYLNYIASYLAEQGHDVTIICRSHEEKPHRKVNFVVLRPLALGAAHRIYTFAKAVEQHLKTNKYDIVYGLGRTWSQDVLRLGGGSHLTYLEKSHYITHSRLQDYLKLTNFRHKAAIDIERKALTSHLPLKVICNSNMVKLDIINRYHVPEERIVVIHNGTDTEQFNADHYRDNAVALRQELNIKNEELVFLFLGTGYKRKGLDIALKAFVKYIAAGRQARLIITGYDSAVAEFKQMAKQLDIASSCRFLGGRRDPEVIYAASDVYLLPTRYDPFANSTVEALASGLPVITSENNGGCELIENFKNGSVIKMDGDEVGELFDAMCYWSNFDALKDAAIESKKIAQLNKIELKLAEAAELLIDVYKLKNSIT